MEPDCIKLVSIIDRLAHDSTTDQDALQTVYGLRRVVKGNMPSALLHLDTSSTLKTKQVANLKRLVAQLRAEKSELEAQNSELQGDHDRLQTQVELLRSNDGHYHPPGENYSYAEVMEIIREKFGKQNGGLTLWAEYSAELHATDSSSPLLTLSKLQTWRMAGTFPNWAVKQLLSMPVVTRCMHKWSDEDIDFLCATHLADLQKTDDQLAAECTARFGRPINTNMIKSKFNILRKLGRIPMLRPAKPH
jgi:hypothetical protein